MDGYRHAGNGGIVLRAISDSGGAAPTYMCAVQRCLGVGSFLCGVIHFKHMNGLRGGHARASRRHSEI